MASYGLALGVPWVDYLLVCHLMSHFLRVLMPMALLLLFVGKLLNVKPGHYSTTAASRFARFPCHGWMLNHSVSRKGDIWHPFGAVQRTLLWLVWSLEWPSCGLASTTGLQKEISNGPTGQTSLTRTGTKEHQITNMELKTAVSCVSMTPELGMTIIAPRCYTLCAGKVCTIEHRMFLLIMQTNLLAVCA